MHQSIAVNSSPEVINMQALNPLISKCQIKVCYVGEEANRNGSVITKEVATEMAKSLGGAPIVGYYNSSMEDFEGHNRRLEISGEDVKMVDTTKPYGFVSMTSSPWFQKFSDEGVEHEYLMVEGYLWTEIYEEAKRVIQKGNNQSMELDEKTLKGHWSEEDNNPYPVFIIDEAIISKLCILGEEVEPCFEGAQISALNYSLDDNFKQRLFAMMKQVEEFLQKEGGVPMNKEEVLAPEVEAEEVTAIEEKAEEVEAEVKVEEPAEVKEEPKVEEEAEAEEVEAKEEEEEKSSEEDKKVEYNLEEIQEYMELKASFEELQNSFNELQANYEELVEFKKVADRKDKQAMIDQFCMLSEEDKQDVVDNIDKYSVEDIENKLSVICFRKKINFSLNDSNPNTTVNIDAFSMTEPQATSDWVKAVVDTQKEMHK